MRQETGSGGPSVAPKTASKPAVGSALAREVEVIGVVQGVGFRPFVWRLATRAGLTGRVRNKSGVVEIIVEGSRASIEEFCTALENEAPTLARVEAVCWREVAPVGFVSFEVEDSVARPGGERLISPDVATCENCLRELFDPDDRRYRYPFVNCTDCGPRFTIIESLPYDRERTSMRAFPLCQACASEYLDPSDRRFHAEPIACPECGPTLELLDADGKPADGDPIERAAALLADGGIVALKGLGGFHLACDATNDAAVSMLRDRKRRPHKPFAVMVAGLDEARKRFDVSGDEEAALASPRAPIVLVEDRGTLSASVAPGHRRQGAMLPSTPLHHLLVRAAGRPLVMTSGNRSEEPICISNDEALERLAGIADAFLVHDREIVARYDDTVVRVWRGGFVVMRRARSCAPNPLTLGAEVIPTLGTGAELHGAFCLAAGTRAYLSQHIGDLDTEESMTAYRDALDRYQRIFGLEPELVAHDAHPDFLSTRFAEELGLPSVAVQHHHAHVASVMAEHQLEGRVIGVAFDGFGLGLDGTAWGGEFLVCDAANADRIGHLRTVALPGGDAAVRNPWRMALAHAEDAGLADKAIVLLDGHQEEAEVLLQQIRSGVGMPTTSSAGRLFDAVAALAGLADVATYEGHPAMLLEQAAECGATREYGFEVVAGNGGLILDTRPIVTAVVKDLRRGRPPGEIAGRFHRTMAAATLEVCRAIRGMTGLGRVCLSGGVFNNDLLTSDLVARLETVGLEVFLPRQAPVGDGGISLGQVLVANAGVAH
jgi:hydrogenase maturation protein HypF